MQKDYTKIDEQFNDGFKGWILQDQQECYRSFDHIKLFIHNKISLSEQSLIERVEKEMPKYANECDKLDEVDERARMTNLLNENMVIGYNQAVTDFKNLLTSLKHLPQEEVKNK